MSWLNDIEKFDKQAAAKLFGILVLVVPGIAILFTYYRPLIVNLDVIKIVLLAMMFVIPVFIIMLLSCIFTFENVATPEEDEVGLFIILALILTNLVIFVWIFIGIVTEMSHRGFLYGIAATSLSMLLLSLVINYFTSKGSKT